MAYVDAREVPNHIKDIGWLIAGLSRLAQRIDDEAAHLRHHLKDESKHYETKGGVRSE